MNKTLAIAIIIVIIVAGAIFLVARQTTQPGPLDGLAQCLKDKGTIFYGAFWCPHCQNQKRLFGNSARLLPYVECSTADGQEVLPICREAKVTGYPTWVFPDQSRESGEVPLETLATRSGCSLTATSANATTTSATVGTTTQP